MTLVYQLFCFYLHLDKSMALYLKTSHLIGNALDQESLKLVLENVFKYSTYVTDPLNHFPKLFTKHFLDEGNSCLFKERIIFFRWKIYENIKYTAHWWILTLICKRIVSNSNKHTQKNSKLNLNFFPK